MAKLASITSGNFTSSSTWGVINEQSFQTGTNTTTSYSVTTTPTSLGTFSPTSTVTATHIGFRLVGTGNIGTLTFDIFNVTAGAQVAGTSVTINKSALNFNSGSLSSTWYLVKIPTPPSLVSGTNYAIRVSHTAGSTTSIMASTAAATNTFRFIVTSTTQAPASTDDLWVVSEWTTGSTVNEFTVTMDNTTSATTFGSANASYGGVSLNTNAYLNYDKQSSQTIRHYNLNDRPLPCRPDQRNLMKVLVHRFAELAFPNLGFHEILKLCRGHCLQQPWHKLDLKQN